MGMHKLLSAIKWDFLRQLRYNIISAAVVVNALYILLLWNLPAGQFGWLAIFMIFNEPVGMGLLFIGALYLFEKSENTLAAMGVTPLPAWQYLAAKTASLMAIALAGSLAIAWAVFGWHFNYLYFIAGAALSASLFTLLGVCLAAGARNFNDYLLRSILVLIPSALPFLNYFGFTDTYWWYLLPSQGSIILLEASFGEMGAWQIAYALVYLLGANLGAFPLALRQMKRHAKF
jgi:fluoroquinolone transport system permease protein